MKNWSGYCKTRLYNFKVDLLIQGRERENSRVEGYPPIPPTNISFQLLAVLGNTAKSSDASRAKLWDPPARMGSPSAAHGGTHRQPHITHTSTSTYTPAAAATATVLCIFGFDPLGLSDIQIIIANTWALMIEEVCCPPHSRPSETYNVISQGFVKLAAMYTEWGSVFVSLEKVTFSIMLEWHDDLQYRLYRW